MRIIRNRRDTTRAQRRWSSWSMLGLQNAPGEATLRADALGLAQQHPCLCAGEGNARWASAWASSSSVPSLRPALFQSRDTCVPLTPRYVHRLHAVLPYRRNKRLCCQLQRSVLCWRFVDAPRMAHHLNTPRSGTCAGIRERVITTADCTDACSVHV